MDIALKTILNSKIENTQIVDIIREKLKNLSTNYIHVYIDVQNMMKSLYVDDVVYEIVTRSYNDETRTTNMIDSTIFQSILYNASWWKKLFCYLKCNGKVFFYTDQGKSAYHTEIQNDYKLNRELSWSKRPQYYQDLSSIKQANFGLSEQFISRLNNIYFFNLKYLESDFVPYYLITRKYKDMNILNLILSTDKDFLQTLCLENVILISKKSNGIVVLDKNNALRDFSKLSQRSIKTQEKKAPLVNQLNIRWFPLLLAIIGDTSDHIKGVDKIGIITAIELFSNKEMVQMLLGYNIDEVYGRIKTDNKLFKDNVDVEKIKDKKWRQIYEAEELLMNNLKLISFELLSTWLESENSLHKNEICKYFERVLTKDRTNLVNNDNILYESLSRLGNNQIEYKNIKYLIM